MESIEGKQFSSEYLNAIGRVTVEFARLELIVGICVGSLMKDLGFGFIAHAKLPLKTLLDVLDALARRDNPNTERLKELERLIKAIANAEERRNMFVHSMWSFDEKTKTVTRSKTTAHRGKGMQHLTHSVGLEELNSLVSDIDQYSTSLLSIISNYRK